MSAVLEQKRRAVVLSPIRMGLAEAMRNQWVVTAEIGTRIEDVLLPGYWAHVAEKLRPLDEIRVVPDDVQWMLRLIVTSCDRNWAKVRIESQIEWADDMAPPAASVQHEVMWKGPHYRWCVVRKADGARVSDGHEDKTRAADWMREHERIVA